MGKISLRETNISGVYSIIPQLFIDDRGFFLESYSLKDFQSEGFRDIFVQDNHSKSQKGVLRGLHYQYPHPQVKLIRVISGSIFDVAVDIRKGSPTYGKYTSIVLNSDTKSMFYIPIGFAHGFLVLEDNTEVIYKVDDYYFPKGDAGIIWNDPDIAINWPFKELEITNPIISDKDSRHKRLKDIESPFNWNTLEE